MVDDDGRTDDGACHYYKLTYEPKGSGELKPVGFSWKNETSSVSKLLFTHPLLPPTGLALFLIVATVNFNVFFKNTLSPVTSFVHILEAFSSRDSFIRVRENELSTMLESLLSNSPTVASARLSSEQESGFGGRAKNVESP